MDVIVDLIEWIKQRTNKIADVAGVLGFLMALSTWIFTIMQQRRKLRFRIVHCYLIPKHYYFYMLIENLSRLPILISQVYLVNAQGQKLECRVTPKMVYETVRKINGEEKSREVVKNLQFPIELPSLGGLSGYISFEDYQEIFQVLPTDVNFEVHTNRGSSFRLTLQRGTALDLGNIR